MKPNKLITDTRPIDQPQESYLRAYNIMVNRSRGAIMNEYGFKPFEFLGKKVFYALPVDNNALILWAVDQDAPGSEGSTISKLTSTGRHTIIVSDDALNLQPNSLFKALFIRNFKGELVVIYTDNVNPVRIVNTDNIYPKVNEFAQFINPGDVDLLNLNPKRQDCDIEFLDVKRNGGNLESGVYYITTSYDIPEGGTTEWGPVMGPISITDDVPIDGYDQFDGTESGKSTSKAIQFNINNIDTRYEHVNVAVIKKIGGVLTAEHVYRSRITGTSETVLYTGTEVIKELVPEELLVDNNIYRTAKTLSLIGNTLTQGNLTVDPLKEFNYQKWAKDIKLSWTTSEVSMENVEGSYKDEKIIASMRGFFPDEVYSFYARLIFKGGIKSDAFHIAGPSAEERDFFVGTNIPEDAVAMKIKDLMELGDDFNHYKLPYPIYSGGTQFYESQIQSLENLVEDLAIDPDIKFFHAQETATLDEEDNMGVWYNESERYPDDVEVWGELAGQPVRHHKMPGLSMFAHSQDPIVTGTGASKLIINKPKTFGMQVNKASNQGDTILGTAYAIPFTAIKIGDPSIQSQAPHDNFDSSDFSYVLDCDINTDITSPEQGEHIYYHLGANWSSIFFYAGAKQAQTKRVKYDFKWKYEAETPFALDYGDAIRIEISLMVSRDITDQGSPYKHYWYHAPGTDDHYIFQLETITGIADLENTLIHTQGQIDVPLQEGGSMVMTVQLIHTANGQDNLVAVNTTIFEGGTIEVVDPLADDSNNTEQKGKVLGIKASNVVIPEEIADQVEGYEIMYAKRDENNTRILGQSLLFGSGGDPLTPNQLGTHAGNNITEVVTEEVGGGNNTTLRDDKIRFHSFDMLRNKPNVSPSYIKAVHLLEAGITNKKTIPDVYHDPAAAEGSERLTSDSPIQAHYTWDYAIFKKEDENNMVNVRNFIRPVKDMKYLDSGAVTEIGGETLNNSYGEDCILLDVHHEVPAPFGENTSAFGWLPSNEEFLHQDNDDEIQKELSAKYYLGNLVTHRLDMYKSFMDQDLVSTNMIFPTGGSSGTFQTTKKIFGGDTFLSYYGIKLTAPVYRNGGNYFSINNNEGLRTIFYFPCYSVANIGLRHAGKSLTESYYPKIGKSYADFEEWLKQPISPETSNVLLYNDDYTSVNDLKQVQPYDHEEDFFKDFPYRIIKSKPYLPEDKEFSLRVFLPNDFYEIPKNKGEITNLEGYGSALFIHTQSALFKTATQERLSTDSTEVVLGTGELFSIEPTEVQPSKEGFAGLQDPRSALLFPGGYIFIDQEQDKIFIAGKGIDEITKYGNREHFRKNLKLKMKEQAEENDLPLTVFDNVHDALGMGYSIAYDSEYERLIISKKDYMLSYVPEDILVDIKDALPYPNQPVIENGRYRLIDGGFIRDFTEDDIETYFEDHCFTFSFDIANKTWICQHNYIPDILVATRSELFSFKQGIPYRHNDINSYGKYYNGDIYPSFADVVFNPASKVTKLFPGIQWTSEIVDSDGVSKYLETITHIAIFTSTHSTGLVPLTNMENIRNVEGHWNFNKIRDVIVDRNLPFMDKDGNFIESNLDDAQPFYQKRRIAEKYAIVRFLYDNLAQKTLYLYDVSATYIESRR